MTRRSLVLGVALTAVLVALAGCGRRGSLEAPPGVTEAPRQAASQRMVAPVAQVTTSDSGNLDGDPQLMAPPPMLGEVRPVAVAPAPIDPNKPKKHFILDSLVK